jgi:hypothetical protein
MISTKYEIFTGNFGSGKTELSLNFARCLSKTGKTALADLDIVNPYFRSSGQELPLTELGIEVIKTAFAGTGVDVPGIPPEVNRLFGGEFQNAVIDVGGDPTGARVLGRYAAELKDRDASCNLVVNTARPFTSTAEDIIDMCRQIEARARIPVTHIINNTNLAEETTAKLLYEGQLLLEQVSLKLSIPIRYITGTKQILDEFTTKYGSCHQGQTLSIDTYMRPLWLRENKTDKAGGKNLE